LLGCAYLFLGRGVNAQSALGLNAVAIFVALLTATHFLHKTIPQEVRDASAIYQAGAWLRSGLPMMLIGGMNVINHRIDTIMLGVMKEADAVGIYTVANRGAQLILLVQTAVNVALAPTIASLHAAGEMQRLQRVMTKSAQMVTIISLSSAIGLVLFGRWFLLLFGSDFAQGHLTLAILATGCVVNTVAGSVGLVLMMTGRERDAAIGVGTGVVLNVIMNAALIPRWGVEGAAIATSVSMMARNLLMAHLVYQRLGIYSTALGRITLTTKA
jgi:O-antigen/teichoic acid export membrane protein